MIQVAAVRVAGAADAVQLATQVVAASQWVGIEPLPDGAYAVQVKRENQALLDRLRAALPEAATSSAGLEAAAVARDLDVVIGTLGADGYTTFTSAPPDQYLDYSAYVTQALALPMLALAATLHDLRDAHPAGATFVTGLLAALEAAGDGWNARLADAQASTTDATDRQRLAWLAQGGGPVLPSLPPRSAAGPA